MVLSNNTGYFYYNSMFLKYVDMISQEQHLIMTVLNKESYGFQDKL